MEFLKEDLDMKFLVLIVGILAVFVGTTTYYHLKVNNLQDQYDLKVANLEKIEQQLIAQEEKLKELSEERNLVNNNKEELEDDYGSMKTRYEILRLEKQNLAEELDSKPFSKTLCKASANVQCFN